MMRHTTFILLCGMLALLGISGCGPEHREVGFSPEGKYIAMISNAGDQSESAIMVRLVDAEGRRPAPVYTATKGMKIYDIFWKGDSLVFFESGEDWACGEAPEKQPPDPMPQFQARVARFKLDESNPKPGKVETLIGKSFDCWISSSKPGQLQSNRRLDTAEITNAKHGDVIVLTNFMEDTGGFLSINVRTGDVQSIMNKRAVSEPIMSQDGSMLAFSERFEIPVLDAQGADNYYETHIQLLVTPLPDIKEKIIPAPEQLFNKFWTRDNRFLFVTAALPSTVECIRESVRLEEGDPTCDDEQLHNGQCRKKLEVIPESKRDPAAFVYFDETYDAVFKMDTIQGTAALWKRNARVLNILSEQDEILYAEEHDGEEAEYFVADISGQVLRKAGNKDMEGFDDVSPDGHKANFMRSYELATLHSPDSSEAEPLIARDQDLLSASRYFYTGREYETAARYMDESIDAAGPPAGVTDKLIAFDVYRHAGRGDQARAMAASIPRLCLLRFTMENVTGITYPYSTEQCD